MSRATLWLGSLVAACLLACGSRGPLEIEGDVGDDTTEPDEVQSPATGGSGSSPEPDDGVSGNAGTSSTPSMPPSQDPLPECVLGPPRVTAGDECSWLVADRCYEERIAACACACPRDRNSTCISGSPGREVTVTCF